MLRLSGDSNPGSRIQDLLHCRRVLYEKSHSNGRIKLPFGISLVLLQLPPKLRWGIVAECDRLFVEYAWRSDRMHVAAWELRITSGSPLCRGLTRSIYTLCIEHLRMLRLSGDSNPGPPALQASTLWKEPFDRIKLPFGISLVLLQYSNSQIFCGNRLAPCQLDLKSNSSSYWLALYRLRF